MRSPPEKPTTAKQVVMQKTGHFDNIGSVLYCLAYTADEDSGFFPP